jgi:uncharacterized protein YndB with AHSA1/START domain
VTEQIAEAVRVQASGPSVLIVEADLPMTPDEAYAHWTDPQRLARWWAPAAQIDPAAGGTYRFSWPQQDWHLSGRVLEANPGRLLRLTWRWEHEPDRPERELTVEFEPMAEGKGSRLTVTHGTYTTGEMDQAERQEHLEGWLHFLARLAALKTA